MHLKEIAEFSHTIRALLAPEVDVSDHQAEATWPELSASEREVENGAEVCCMSDNPFYDLDRKPERRCVGVCKDEREVGHVRSRMDCWMS